MRKRSGSSSAPGYPAPFAKVLQVTLIIAMVVAAVKVAWILVFQA